MKVIVVHDTAAIDGGSTKIAILGARGCADAGIDVHYVASNGPVAPELTGSDRLKVTCLGQLDIKENPNRLQAAAQGIANTKMASTLSQIIRRADPDTIVHIHSWSKSLSPFCVRAAAKAARQAGIPVAMSLHEYFTACPNGAFFDFAEGQVCRRTPLSWGCVSCNCDSRSYRIKLWRLARVFAQKHLFGVPACINNYIMMSSLGREVLTPFLPADCRIYMLNNPISVKDSGRAIVERHKRPLFVGRFSREKGVANLAKALQDLRMSAVFVGDGHLRAEIQAQLPDSEFTGWLGSEAVSARMREARVLAFPSTWYEVQPLTPIEAAANGVPSIISDCTTAVEYIEHDKQGLHFRHDSVEALKQQLIATQNDELIERLSRNAYSWYWNNPWTIQRHTDGLIDIYDKILSSAKTPRQTVVA